MASFVLNAAFADVGKIIKIVGGDDAYVIRQGEKISLTPESLLEVGDEIRSSGTHLVMVIFPDIQISLPRLSEMRLKEATIEETPEHLKSQSLVELIKGQIRCRVTKQKNHEVEHTVQVTNAAFAVRGTEFEVGIEGDDVDLDVEEGEVEFSSPLVHTFVPEMIKRNEGFRFSRKNKKYIRRKIATRMQNHPGFLDRQELKERFRKWKEKRASLREGKGVRKQRKEKRLEVVRRERRRGHK